MKRLLILCSLMLGLALAAYADITREQIGSVVRILSLGEGGGTGTGFVISNDGLIITNNHVIASGPSVADHPFNYIVLQRVGDRVIAYRGTFVAQDPKSDLAAIRCSGITASPFQLLNPAPEVFQDVYSIGFPGVADETQVINGLHVGLFTGDLVSAIGELVNQQKAMPADITDLFPEAFKKHLQAIAGSTSDPDLKKALEDFCSTVQALQLTKFLQDFATPTSTTGKVEKLTEGSVNSGPSIPLIEHSCNIRGGNSGGPLLNGGGQILGVVGDAYVVPEGPHKGEQVTLAVQTVQLQNFLQTNGITGFNVTNTSWKPSVPGKINFIPIIIAASLAIAVALAALLITLIKARRRTGMTALVESLKKKGISSGTQLLEVLGAKPKSDGSPARSAVLPTPKGGNWKLDGRTSAGKTFQIPISESMFATNSSRLVLGRSRDLCDLVVEDETVSRQHAEIRKKGTGFVVADRNSSNGTAVNGVFNRKPFEPVPFKPGDTLTVGDVKLDFR